MQLLTFQVKLLLFTISTFSMEQFSLKEVLLPPYSCGPSVQFSYSRLFVTPRTAACQASLAITNSQSLLKLMFIESVMPSNHLQINVCRWD